MFAALDQMKRRAGSFLLALRLQIQPILTPERLNSSTVNVSQSGIYLRSQNNVATRLSQCKSETRTT